MAKGDHLVVTRLGGFFTHHGIDCGDGSVIHLVAGNPREASVRRVNYEQFCKDAEPEVRDYSRFFEAMGDGERMVWKLRSTLSQWALGEERPHADSDFYTADAVVERAESRLGARNYHLFLNNCEHFASWCKTGIRGSAQIDGIWKRSMSPMFAQQRMLRRILGDEDS